MEKGFPESKVMICLICRQAELVDGLASVTFERGEVKLVVIYVPARICPHCGEAVLEEVVALRLLDMAEDAARAGMHETIVEYEAVEV